MMAGLGEAASIIAVIQISGKVFDLCQTYYVGVKEARKDIKRLREEITSLQDVLVNLADLADDPGMAQGSILSLLNQQRGPVQQCQKDLTELITKLEAKQAKNKMKQFGLRTLKWPFTSKDVEKLLAITGRHKATFNLALTMDHVGLARSIKDDVTRLSDGIAELQVRQKTLIAREIQQWLSSPDASSNHNAACKKRQLTTGAWFIESDEFNEWKTCPNSFLWLHGIPGCGKTILCSTIIEHVKSLYGSDPTVAITFFYFDFNDTEKQRHEKLLRSLIEQLSMQSVKSMDVLNILFANSHDGRQQPTKDALLLALQHMLRNFQRTFIILDALDECKEREELLGFLEHSMNWKFENLHVLTTSRRERDIEETLTYLATDQICIQSALISADIQTHICEQLQNDPKLKKWPINVQREIEKTLMDGAHGMFRWVVCQLDALRKCLKLNALRKALHSLPKTLDDTYARILYSIDEEYSQDAFTILQWLVYSVRPLRIEEVAEVVAIDIDHLRFEAENRLPEPRDVLTICSSLVTSTAVMVNDGYGVSFEAEELRLAHFSVKEYLISDRVRTIPAPQYNIQLYAEDRIAQACLIYLLQFNESTLLTLNNIDDFPLARYAAEQWTRHARAATKDVDRVSQLITQLFLSERGSYINWIRLFDPDSSRVGVNMSKSISDVPSPLYYASLEGLFKSVVSLLEKGANINNWGGYYGNALQAASIKGYESIVMLLLDKGADVNAQGGWYRTALQAASIEGYESIVTLLLDKGADINIQGGPYGNALQAASVKGDESIVMLLLDKGADVKAQGGDYGNALQAASIEGNESIVTLLLDKGADVNIQGGLYENALQAASIKGYQSIVTLLLEKEADVNAQGGRYRNALQAASIKGDESIVTLLLDKGADVNAQGGDYGNALQAASIKGNESIVTLLLDRGADVNAQGRPYGNALQAALIKGNESIVTLLLDKGADVNAQGGPYGNALQAASVKGNESIVTLLLDKGADVNAQGRPYGSAIQAASIKGNESIVSLLLEKEADVNAQGGRYRTALQAASIKGDESIVTLLLDKGADVNAQGGDYGDALQAASIKGNEPIVTLLLDKGADVNAQGRPYGNALQAASIEGNESIVMLLLDKGADVNAQGGLYGNALQAASVKGDESIVTLLLDKGADVNSQGGDYGNALQAASIKGDESIVTLLLDKGADVNSQGGDYGNALQAASIKGNESIVTLLLDKGADVNAQGGRYRNALQAASMEGNESIVTLLLDKGANINTRGR
ncbi:ankyrin repeat-containing domain protein [Tricladium varicosporioides]|nr:ankyrin repeat-containing domain protein [Hymenoscyphus varicosporioides]